VSASNVVEISIDVRRDNPDYFVLLYEGSSLVVVDFVSKFIYLFTYYSKLYTEYMKSIKQNNIL